jgi:NAD(P)-dependent dehydrogenase (short-subunit alcohol dehydrogenase family)
MQIQDSVALVTGARRGIGAEWVRQLQERGARKVYAAVRDGSQEPIPGAELLHLDVTDPVGIARAAVQVSDLTLLVNNAGIAAHARLTDGDLTAVRNELEVNFFGPLNTVRAFAPILGANGGGAIVNVLSALAWFAYDGAGGYAAAKASAWSLTDSVRLELRSQNTQVSSVMMGAVDTDMSAHYDGPKISPHDLVEIALDGIEAGRFEILADDTAKYAKASLNLDPEQRYAALPAA